MTRRRLTLGILLGITLALVLVELLRQTDNSAGELTCQNNLRQIGLALTNYQDAFRAYPPAHAGHHSWRIRVLPFFWSSPQFDDYDFSQPWDAATNISIGTRPLPDKSGELRSFGNPYGPPCDGTDPQLTSYMLIVGQHAFAAPDRPRMQAEILDGMTNTIAAAEIANTTIHWLAPVDLDFDTMSFKINDGPASISSAHPHGPAVLFCDGEVFRVNPDIDPATVKALCTIDGGEEIERDSLVAQGLLRPARN